MPNNIKELLSKLNIVTNKYDIYIEALTHTSYSNENKSERNYERLEFLGDAIISKIISCYLYHQDFDEQEMTENRQVLVRSKTLIMASNELKLIDYALLGNGIKIETDTNNIREDIFESFIGAVYLDIGEVKVFEILKNTIIKYFENNEIADTIDYKTRVQEWLQSKTSKNNKNSTIQYKCSSTKEHPFECSLVFNNITYGFGFGETKREAEKQAAKEAYEKCINNVK
ncbi:MAG: ribonuclease III [Malacoplasma sp.]